jgi:hypothetical protein
MSQDKLEDDVGAALFLGGNIQVIHDAPTNGGRTDLLHCVRKSESCPGSIESFKGKFRNVKNGFCLNSIGFTRLCVRGGEWAHDPGFMVERSGQFPYYPIAGFDTH